MSITRTTVCQKIPNFLRTHYKEGAAIAGASGVIAGICGPLIAGLGALGYIGYRALSKKEHPFRQHERFKRLSDQEFNQIVQKAQSAGACSQEIIEAFQQGIWTHEIFSRANWPDYALKALFSKQIDEETFTKLMLYDACKLEAQEGRVQCKQLIHPDGSVDPEAMDILVQSTCGYFDESHWTGLLQQLRNSPEKSQFFLVDVEYKPGCSILYGMDKLRDITGKKDFLSFRLRNQLVMLTPELLFTLLSQKFPGGPKPLCFFGVSEREVLSGKTRPFSMPCRYTKASTAVPNYSKSHLGFLLHDYYHELIECAIGSNSRSVWIDFAKYVRNKYKIRPGYEKAAETRFEVLIDRDFPVNADHRTQPNHKFWATAAQVRFFYDGAMEDFSEFYFKHEQKLKDQGVNLENLDDAIKNVASIPMQDAQRGGLQILKKQLTNDMFRRVALMYS